MIKILGGFIVPLIPAISATGETKTWRKGGVSVRLSGPEPPLDLRWYQQMCPVGNFRAVWHVHRHIIIAMCPLGARVPFDDEPPTGISFMVAVCVGSDRWTGVCIALGTDHYFSLCDGQPGEFSDFDDNFNGVFVAREQQGKFRFEMPKQPKNFTQVMRDYLKEDSRFQKTQRRNQAQERKSQSELSQS